MISWIKAWCVTTKILQATGKSVLLSTFCFTSSPGTHTEKGMSQSWQPHVWACNNCTWTASERPRKTPQHARTHTHTGTLLYTSKANLQARDYCNGKYSASCFRYSEQTELSSWYIAFKSRNTPLCLFSHSSTSTPKQYVLLNDSQSASNSNFTIQNDWI